MLTERQKEELRLNLTINKSEAKEKIPPTYVSKYKTIGKNYPFVSLRKKCLIRYWFEKLWKWIKWKLKKITK